MRSPGVPLLVRIRAEQLLRQRRKERSALELRQRVVLMPALDPPLVPPEDDLAVEGAAQVVRARQDRLAALMAKWKAGQ